MTQHEYVKGCLLWYKQTDRQQGNPEDGDWEHCHYPEPACLGGTATILLLKEHHAVQGVLQSEEYNRPCVWGWESRYLTGQLLECYNKWKAMTGFAAVKNKTGIHDPANKEKVLAAGARGRRTARINKLGIHSEKTKQKNRKKVIVRSFDGWEKNFSSIREACAELGMREQHLSRVLRGERVSHRGFTARYAEL